MHSSTKRLHTNTRVYLESPLQCALCDEDLNYSQRYNKFCGHSCAGTYNNRRRVKKVDYDPCAMCGEDMVRSSYVAKKFCDAECRTAFVKKSTITKWLAGSEEWNGKRIPRWLREYLVAESKNTCSVCGISEWMGKPLTVECDHIDGDSFHNMRKNLRIVCPNCHSQTPTYKAKNWGNGRYPRSAKAREAFKSVK